MPVQINEIIVRAVVDPRPSDGRSEEAQCAPSGNSGSDAEIQERVLEILREKTER